MLKLSTLKNVAFLGVLLLVVSVVFAQSDMPPQPNEFGKCYAKCKIADQYETVATQVLAKEASSKKSVTPAVYETVQEQVLVKEGSTQYKVIPAVYETVTERMLVKDASTTIKVGSPKYQTVSERILVRPAYGEWVKKKKYPNCLSANPDDCYIMCWEERAAEYKTVSKQIASGGAGESVVEVPAKYTTIKVQRLVSPARVEEKIIPPVYKTVSVQKIISPARVNEEVIPAVYKSINEKKLIRAGGFTEWVEILCASDTTPGVVRRVQQALKDNGYSPGPIDGVMGIQTKNALSRYQSDKGLPQGNLNKETLSSLGVGY